MKKIIFILMLLLTNVYAELNCKTDIYFANGIDTNETEAEANLDILEKKSS